MFSLTMLSVQPRRSAYMVYIRSRSAANSAPSSPPIPARISSITFFSSLGSRGSSSRFSSSCKRSISPFAPASSSCAKARSSGSGSISSASRAVSCARRYACQHSTTGASSFCSRRSAVSFSRSVYTAGSASCCSTSVKCAARALSFSCMVRPQSFSSRRRTFWIKSFRQNSYPSLPGRSDTANRWVCPVYISIWS